jgi:hypothetical protein
MKRLTATVLLVVALGCGGGGEPDAAEAAGAIDRETFIAAWVELRTAALVNGEGTLAPADRDRVLSGLGITEDDLLQFADLRGGDVEYMRGVWDEVERRLAPPPAVPDSAG